LRGDRDGEADAGLATLITARAAARAAR